MKVSSADLCSGPFEVRLLIVSARDKLLSGGGTKFGSFWACDVKLEPNLCLVGSAAVLGTGVKFSL